MTEISHPTVLREPIDGPTAWRSSDLERDPAWRYRLAEDEIEDLEHALAHCRTTGKPTTTLERDDFPLSVLAPRIASWMLALEQGRGFQNVCGLPIDRWSAEDRERIFFGLGTHLGTAVSQNAAGDLLSHVRDTGANAANRGVRLYKTNVELGYHSDGSDIAALFCLRPALFGGSNRLVSCSALYNEFQRRKPDLVEVLYQPFSWDRNDEQPPGEPPHFDLPICSYVGGHFRMFYIGWYIRQAQRHHEVPRLSADQVQALDLIDEIAAEPEMHFEFRLEPGEINFLKNSAALHMRTAFGDDPHTSGRRHLLRLWLTAHGQWADHDAFVSQGIPRKAGTRSDAAELTQTTEREDPARQGKEDPCASN